MRKQIQVTNDRGRLELAGAVAAMAEVDHENAKENLPSEIKEMAVNTADSFETVLTRQGEAYGLRRNLAGVIREKGFKLSRCVHHVWTSLEHTRQRLELPDGFLEIYRYPVDAGRPKAFRPKRLVQIAKGIIAGSVQAEAAGYPPLLSPSIEDLRVFLEGLEQAIIDHHLADLAYQQIQLETQSLRKQFRELVYLMNRHLRHELRAYEPSARRRIMRKFGFRYSGDSLTPVPKPEPEEDVEPVKPEGESPTAPVEAIQTA